MAQVIIPWIVGDGAITLIYTGQGDGTVAVASDSNNLATARSKTITITGGGITRQVTIVQKAKPAPTTPNFILSDGKYLKLSDGKYFNVQENT